MNVDGLHTAAGSTNVCEVHGTVRRLRCKTHGVVSLPLASAKEMHPYRCPTCQGHLRPDVVLFTEGLPHDEWVRAADACQALTQKDCMLVIGTTGAVYPAAGLPESVLMSGAHVIEINMDSSPISHAVDVFLQGRAKDLVPQLVNLALEEAEDSRIPEAGP